MESAALYGNPPTFKATLILPAQGDILCDPMGCKHKQELGDDDLETIDKHKSWGSVQDDVLNEAPQSVSLIRPALEHLNVFSHFFATNLATSPDPGFFWGALACLLQVSQLVPPSAWFDCYDVLLTSL